MTNVTCVMKALIVFILLFTFNLAHSQEQSVEKATRVQKIESTNEQSGAKSNVTKRANPSPQSHAPSNVAKVPTETEQSTTHAKPDGEQKNEKKEESWWTKLFTDPVAFFTCLLFLATLALWWATRCLVVGAEKSSELQLRAYISSSPDFIWSFNPKTPATMRYTMKNHGQTPAYSVESSAVVDIFPYPLPADFRFPPLPTPTTTLFTLHAGEAIFGNVVAQRAFTTREISDAVNNEGCRIYCFGIVKYESFGSAHTTKFCRSIVGCQNLQFIASGTTKPHLDLNYEIASLHNQAD